MKSENKEQITDAQFPTLGARMNCRSEALAARLEAGATALAFFAATLPETEWQTRLRTDGRLA